MRRSRSITFLASVALPLAAVAVVGFGGSAAATASSLTPPASAHTKIASRRTPAVRVADSSLGRILVNSAGRTLYLFKADVGHQSACSGACATAWPPLLATAKATVDAGLTASKLGTIRRSGGKRQVTYAGHPLYLFVKDHKPGDVHGQGVVAFGAAWFVVSPAGKQIASKASSHSGSSSTAPPATSGIPQNNGGDGDSDNNGGPSDGDGNF
jgi:predicted lipoprotein with Yx(FWY)xxD motif